MDHIGFLILIPQQHIAKGLGSLNPPLPPAQTELMLQGVFLTWGLFPRGIYIQLQNQKRKNLTVLCCPDVVNVQHMTGYRKYLYGSFAHLSQILLNIMLVKALHILSVLSVKVHSETIYHNSMGSTVSFKFCMSKHWI